MKHTSLVWGHLTLTTTQGKQLESVQRKAAKWVNSIKRTGITGSGITVTVIEAMNWKLLDIKPKGWALQSHALR